MISDTTWPFILKITIHPENHNKCWTWYHKKIYISVENNVPIDMLVPGEKPYMIFADL